MALAYGDNSLPVISIDAAELSPRAIGLELGRQSKTLFPDIERQYDTYLASLLRQRRFDDLLQHSLPKLVQQLSESYQEEWQGVVDSWSIVHNSVLGDGHLSIDEYQLLNLLPDFGLPPGGTGIGVFGEVSAIGTVVGRNLDWHSNPELRALQAITVYHHKDRTIVNPGFAGITSVVNGFNSHGLFLAYFDAEAYSPYQQFSPHSSHHLSTNVFMLRQALENHQSVHQASAYLSEQVYDADRSVLLADKREIKVLEFPSLDSAEVRDWSSPTQTARPWQRPQQIAVVGCHVLTELKNHCPDVKNSVRWRRLHELLDFSETEPADVAAMGNILSDTANRGFEIFNRDTLQSMLYLPGNNSLYLYAAPVTNDLSAPVYTPYPTLLSDRASALAVDTDVSWLIWVVLIFLLGVVLWVVRKH
ncbi:MAG: hypothetical protein GKR96_08990 [Gammaproteobacteria bacterium]|nr:hypothetical protein [Gammaproteobacteria bacterium]